MFLSFLNAVVGNLFFFALHVDSSMAFPKPLSKKEEEECFARMAEGDSAARSKLIEHNLRLVAHLIKKYYASYKDQDELISIGTVGLIKAVSTFDASKGSTFATYASRCIENEILMHFRAQKKIQGEMYMDEPIDTDKDGNTLTLADLLADDDNILDAVDLNIRSRQLYQFLGESLSKRELEIIINRYGLYGHTAQTQREVAKKLGISRSYVSRIEKKALETLRGRYDNTKY